MSETGGEPVTPVTIIKGVCASVNDHDTCAVSVPLLSGSSVVNMGYYPTKAQPHNTHMFGCMGKNLEGIQKDLIANQLHATKSGIRLAPNS
jgi:hypothetical protein